MRPAWMFGWNADDLLCLKKAYRRYSMPKVHAMDRILRRSSKAGVQNPGCRHWNSWSLISEHLFEETGRSVSPADIEDYFWNVVGGGDIDVIRARLDRMMDISDLAPSSSSEPSQNDGTAGQVLAVGQVAVASTGAANNGYHVVATREHTTGGVEPLPRDLVFHRDSVPNSVDSADRSVRHTVHARVDVAVQCCHGGYADKASQCNLEGMGREEMLAGHQLRMNQLMRWRDFYTQLNDLQEHCVNQEAGEDSAASGDV